MEEGQRSVAYRSQGVILNLGKKTMPQGGTLVGKICTGKNLNIPTVISMIKKGWQLAEGFEVLELERAQLIFLFKFKKPDDYHQILKGRPWSIQGHLLNLQQWEECMSLKDVNFNKASFWVQFHGLLIKAFDNDNVKILGDVVGETIMFEKLMVEGKLERSFIRTSVLIDLDAPLSPGFWVPRDKKSPAWVTTNYERSQNFCYKFGCIGHEAKGCQEPRT